MLERNRNQTCKTFMITVVVSLHDVIALFVVSDVADGQGDDDDENIFDEDAAISVSEGEVILHTRYVEEHLAHKFWS